MTHRRKSAASDDLFIEDNSKSTVAWPNKKLFVTQMSP